MGLCPICRNVVVAPCPWCAAAIARVERRLERTPDGCLVYTRSLKDGYGRTWTGTKSGRRRWLSVHLLRWLYYRGAVPKGKELDHKCRNRACAELADLEPVTRRVNLIRGDTFTARHVRATHCPQGHEYTEGNTLVNKNKRYCIACRLLTKAARRSARRYIREAGPDGDYAPPPPLRAILAARAAAAYMAAADDERPS